MVDYRAPGDRNHSSFAETWADPGVQALLRSSLRGRTSSDSDSGFREWKLRCRGHQSGRRLRVTIGKGFDPSRILSIRPGGDLDASGVWFSPPAAPAGDRTRPQTAAERESLQRAISDRRVRPIARETLRTVCLECGMAWEFQPARWLRAALRQIQQEKVEPRRAANGIGLTAV